MSNDRGKKTGNHNPHGLPTKPCVECGRKMTWRKKWERDWEQVKYCSDACRKKAKKRDDA
jgi:hypothetical protein